MAGTEPQTLTAAEWDELMNLPLIREAWGIGDDETPSELSGRIYAAKFAFHSGGPGYVGDLYVLVGDSFGDGAVILKRDKNGVLLPVEHN